MSQFILAIISSSLLFSGCTLLSSQSMQENIPAHAPTRETWLADLNQYAIDLNFVYGKRTGWIDFSHAFPYGAESKPHYTALNIWRQFQREKGFQEKDIWDHLLVRNFCDQSFRPTSNNYFAISYSQAMGVKGINVAGIENTYLIKKGLPKDIKEQVAYSIFMDVSYKFERLQGMPPYSLGRTSLTKGNADSSYSIEDLPSNVIGFFAVTRGGATDKYGVWQYIKEHAQLVPVAEAKNIKENKGFKSGDYRFNKLPIPILYHDNVTEKPLDVFYTPILAEGEYYINVDHIKHCDKAS